MAELTLLLPPGQKDFIKEIHKKVKKYDSAYDTIEQEINTFYDRMIEWYNNGAPSEFKGNYNYAKTQLFNHLLDITKGRFFSMSEPVAGQTQEQILYYTIFNADVYGFARELVSLSGIESFYGDFTSKYGEDWAEYDDEVYPTIELPLKNRPNIYEATKNIEGMIIKILAGEFKKIPEIQIDANIDLKFLEQEFYYLKDNEIEHVKEKLFPEWAGIEYFKK